MRDYKLRNSIDRATRLLNVPNNYDNYLSIKLTPVPSQCCCFHCWPETWDRINEYIKPNGPIPDEGDALIIEDEVKYVLQCHESGPEIIANIALTTAWLVLSKSIIDLIITFIKLLSNEKRKSPSSLRITRKVIKKAEVEQEDTIEIEIPLSKENQVRLIELLSEKP